MKTKFNIGDAIFTTHNGKTIAFEVAMITTKTKANGTRVRYHETDADFYNFGHEENVCFASKELMIKSL